MRFAVIDLGTNSVRFDVHQLGKKAKVLHREKLMIRLGQGVFLKGRLDKEARLRALQAFQHFARLAKAFRVEKIIAFGTSALREAANAQPFLTAVKNRAAIDVRIISGLEEARFIASGILGNEKKLPGRFALVDIGGGSTEVSVCRGRKVRHSHSFELGTARLQQVFLKKSPPRRQSIARLRDYIRTMLREEMRTAGWPKRVPEVVASSGTAKALSKLSGERKVMSRREVKRLVERMSSMTTSQLLHMDGMEAKRVDMVLAGAILMEEILEALDASKLRVTEFSLRDGILHEELELLRKDKTSRIELHLSDLFNWAQKFGLDAAYVRRLVQLAETLFDELRPLHRLDKKWRIYLVASVILRDLGELVSVRDYEKHTYYIVKNADIPAMQPWEAEFIALLCLHQAAEDFEKVDLPKERRAPFRKLLALLRVIDSIDLGRQHPVSVQRVHRRRSAVILQIRSAGKAGMEALFLDRKKRLFESEFGKRLYLEKI